MILLWIYLAGIVPAIMICGAYNARNGIRDDVPGIINGLTWPLLFAVLCVIVPFCMGVVWLFEQPARLGARLSRGAP